MDEKQEKTTIQMADVDFKFRRCVLLLICIFLWLSILPYFPEDMDYFRGGLSGSLYPKNLLGATGSYIGWFMLISFGLGAYGIAAIVTLGSLRRLVWRGGLRKAGWEYKLSYVLVVLGMVIMLGLCPDHFQAVTGYLNIRTMPGGVLGDFLCAKGHGMLYLLLNSIGTFLIGLVLFFSGLWVLWTHDWNMFAKLLWTKLGNRTRSRKTTEGKSADSAPEEKIEEEENSAKEKLPIFDKEKGKEKFPIFKPRGRRNHPEPQLKTTKMPFFNVKGLKKTTPEFESEISAPTADALPSLKPEYTASQPVLFTELPSEPVTPPEMPQKVISGEAVKVKSAPGNYVLPPMKLLNQPVNSGSTDDHEEIEKKKQIIQMVLDNFQIDAEVVNAIVGPQVTLFEIAPAANVRINEIAKLHNNFAMELQATTLRLLLPIPGQRLVGIEVPNANPRKVFSYELMESESWHHSKMKIPLILGKNIGGETVMLDLARAPHLLIAGATGSGKSVCMNLLITSMLYKFNPDELRLIMIDPKVVEFQPYSTLPHLIVPVITEVDKVSLALRWVINEMERRYRVLAKVGVRNLDDFNNRQISKEEPLDDGGNVIPQKLPYIVVIIDELADIMLYAQKEVEKGLAAIAAKSRAVGIHSIIATQRPDTKVLTGTIKSNYPTRIAFRVPSQIDSRTILDTKGAESLLGRGDMLFKGMRSTERLQGGMIEQAEMERLVSFVSVQAEQHFDEDVLKTQEELAAESAEFDFSGDGGRSESMSLEDKQYREAVEIVLRDKRPTISYLQRTLKIGYNKAADLIDRMERQGVIGPQPSHGNREILVASSAGLNIDDDDLRDDEIDFEDA